MGYKIAGYDVIGCNEIDPRMMKCYETNHHPQYSYLEDIRDLVKRNNLPEELYHLDILDGSPPCSTFSAITTLGFKRLASAIKSKKSVSKTCVF